MRLLLTGAAGYAGSGMGKVLAGKHWVRSLDIRPPGPELQDAVVGDVADLDTCMKALDGIEAVVLCHMAKNPDGYKTPVQAVDINVKGTANLYHAMGERGIKRAVLISTTGVLLNPPGPAAVPAFGPYNFGQDGKQGLYGLTKIMQEILSQAYFHSHGIITTILRPGWIVYDEKLVTKYGEKMEIYYPSLIDPRDIARAVLASLALPDPKPEAFYIGQEDSLNDLGPTRERLGWRPEFRFSTLKKQ